MDLESVVRPYLWAEISNSYSAGSYKNAILDAMRYLSRVIRDKSGLDGDGAQLVGQALGGDEPKLRINRLQTQSERDQQRGFQQIITGLYAAIRNPRTHEDVRDDKDVADSIVYFVNYILSVLDVAKPPFTIEDFVPRVYDEDFVEHKDYVEELIKEIPRPKYLETLIAIYRRKSEGDAKKLGLIGRALLDRLDDREIDEILKVVSDDLDTLSAEGEITKVIRMLPEQLWPRIKKTAKMRIENKLIASIRSGDAILNNQKIRAGHFGTWATGLIDHFSLKEELHSAVFGRLGSDDPENALYILKFFLKYLPTLGQDPWDLAIAVRGMHSVLEKGEKSIRWSLKKFADDAPEEWRSEMKRELADLTNPENPYTRLKDGSPFLDGSGDVVEEDIPF